MATKQQVWVVIPEDDPALARVFGNQESAEKWFCELFAKYGPKRDLTSDERLDRLKDALDNGYFRGHSSKKLDFKTYRYTLNSFMVED